MNDLPAFDYVAKRDRHPEPFRCVVVIGESHVAQRIWVDVFADLLREFLTRQNLPEKSDWALGWDTPTAGASSSGQLFSSNSVGHLGFTGTSLWIDLDRDAIVVMLTNRVLLVAKKSKFTLRPVIHDLIIDSFSA